MRLALDDGKQSLRQSSSDPEISRLLYNGLPLGVRQVLNGPGKHAESLGDRINMRFIHGSSSRRSIGIISRSKVQVLLALAWVLMLWWGEKHVFGGHISTCHWRNWERWPTEANPHHVVLLADPQLVDPHTYPGRPWPLSSLTIRHTDQYLRRSFTALQRSLNPRTVFFLGDLFDGGREWSTDNSKSPEKRWNKYGQDFWLQEYARFGEIFFKPWMREGPAKMFLENRKMIASLPGNHDLGIGSGIQIPVRDRFNAFFGAGNRVDNIGNHTFVSVDTVSLTAKGQDQAPDQKMNSAIWEHTEEFIAGVKDKKAQVVKRELWSRFGQPENVLLDHTVAETDVPKGEEEQRKDESIRFKDMPTILLTHVPLWRKEGTPCGPLREHWPPSRTSSGNDPIQSDDRNAISVRGGYQYQNVLHPQITKDLVKQVGDVEYVFSGDDHDYCEVVHWGLTGRIAGIREITVKSMSWAMGVRRPGFVMVSLWNPVDEHGQSTGSTTSNSEFRTLQSHLCLLPDQLGIFIRYGILLAITFLVLAFQAFRLASQQARNLHEHSTLPFSNPPTPAFDTKNRNRADSNSYASSMNSLNPVYSNNLAMRSNTGRSRPLSPAYGYGIPDPQMSDASDAEHSPSYPLGNPAPPTSRPFTPIDDRKSFAQSSTLRQTPRLWTKKRWRAILAEFLKGWCQVATIGLLWYAWLAYTV